MSALDAHIGVGNARVILDSTYTAILLYSSMTFKTIKRSRLKNNSQSDISDAHLAEVARIFRVLAEPSRLKLLRSLMSESMTVSQLMQATDMRQGNVSKHLSVLLSGGFVERIRDGNFARYELSDPTVVTLCKLMCARVEDRARQKLEELT